MCYKKQVPNGALFLCLFCVALESMTLLHDVSSDYKVNVIDGSDDRINYKEA